MRDDLVVITHEMLTELERLSAACDPGPWTAVVEGRDADSGGNFIQTGPDGARGEDLYVTRDMVRRVTREFVEAAARELPSSFFEGIAP